MRFLIIFILFFPIKLFASELIFSYGFEDWGGTITTTPNYPFNSTYCDDHAANTEVITGYNGKTAHSGSYYLMVSHGGTMMSPTVSGITATGPQPYNIMGAGEVGTGTNCGDNYFDIGDITTGEYFVSFWIYTSDWQPVRDTPDAQLKCIRLYHDTAADPALFYVKRDHHNAPGYEPYFALDGSGDYVNGPVEASFANESWHKVSLYWDYNNDRAAVWYDVENETWANATIQREDISVTKRYPIAIFVIGNWSLYDPTGIMYHGIDDIEVWNGLPSDAPSQSQGISITGGKIE